MEDQSWKFTKKRTFYRRNTVYLKSNVDNFLMRKPIVYNTSLKRLLKKLQEKNTKTIGSHTEINFKKSLKEGKTLK